MRPMYLMVTGLLVSPAACEPGSSDTEKGDADTDLPSWDTSVQETDASVDTGTSLRAECLSQRLEVFAGAWSGIHQGEGTFVPFVPGAPLTLWGVSAIQEFVVNVLVSNAHPRISVEYTLTEGATGRHLEVPGFNVAYMALQHPDAACAALPTENQGMPFNDEKPDGSRSPLAFCEYDGVPVTLTWTATDLVDGRSVSGSVDLVAAARQQDCE